MEQAWLDTFTLLNISPQIPSFNSGVWLALETLVRKLLLEEQQPFEAQGNPLTAIIITGPVWLPSQVVTHSNHNTNVTSKPCFRYDYRGIGTMPLLVAIPTHFYKVIAVVEDERILKLAAFCIPHTNAISTTAQQAANATEASLEHFLVRLSNLEAVTGLTFFDGLEIALNEKPRTNKRRLTLTKQIADALTDDLLVKHSLLPTV